MVFAIANFSDLLPADALYLAADRRLPSGGRLMGVQVIDRAVRMIRVVARLGPISLTGISHAVELPLPTVERIAKSLVTNGVLQRREDRKYELGARVLPLAIVLEPLRKFLQIAHPFVEELSIVVNTDCGIAVLQGNEAVVVDWSYGPANTRVIEPYSRDVPLHCAFGMVLVAFQPRQWRERFLESMESRSTELDKVPARGDLVERIAQIRKTGVYLSIAENVEGAGSLTVPIFDHVSRPLGALFVTAPLKRFGARQTERYRAKLIEQGKKLTRELRRLGQESDLRIADPAR